MTLSKIKNTKKLNQHNQKTPAGQSKYFQAHVSPHYLVSAVSRNKNAPISIKTDPNHVDLQLFASPKKNQSKKHRKENSTDLQRKILKPTNFLID